MSQDGTSSKNWKERLYDAYVSSGQAGIEDPRKKVDFFRSREAFIRAVIKRHVPPDRDARIVDLGCGHGAYIHFLRRLDYRNIQGVDFSSEQVALAGRLGIEGLVCSDAEEYLRTTEELSIDVVLVMDVLEHLTRQGLFDLLDGVLRVLRPGGICIAHVPNAEGLFGMSCQYGDLTHEVALTPMSARQVFSTVGFSEIRGFEDRPAVHGLKSLLRRAVWSLGTLPLRLLVAAETGRTALVLSRNMIVTAVK